MKLLLAFVPFITFALLEHRVGTHAALVAATAVSALLVIRDRFILHASPKTLEVGSLILFGALAFATRFAGFSPSLLSVRLLVDAGLLAIVLGSIFAGRPFTLQYAMERVTPEVAAHPAFRRTAERIAWAWAGAFVVIVLADLAMMYVPAFTPTVGTVVILAALAAAAWFTAWLPKAARR
ncbi:hypothetical protein [Achromobacter spanius]|uniref:Intracellular septation protein A n=1 Tax=Achromobacter spanius TaxID=217203 RepID=A0A2S0I9D8_9BURK|nr:hypothetical protein [Achromobacter spanius]AVJ28669.1 hypothetical protein CLM73_16985 [Achromobacter spanius]